MKAKDVIQKVINKDPKIFGFLQNKWTDVALSIICLVHEGEKFIWENFYQSYLSNFLLMIEMN